MARVTPRNIKERVNTAQRFIPSDKEREAVQHYMAIGLKIADVARVMRIHPKTLAKHFAYEIETGKNAQIASVAQTLFQIATDKTHPKVMSAIAFFLKTRAGWSEKIQVEVSGPNGGPIEHSVIDSRALTLEQREQLREIVQAQLAAKQAQIEDHSDEQPYDDAEFEDVQPQGSA